MNPMKRKKMKIDNIWVELANDISTSPGLLLRRYSGTVLPDVFIALTKPEKYRCIAAAISKSLTIELPTHVNLKDIRVEVIFDSPIKSKKVLLFKLMNNEYSDIFSILCEDMISNISEIQEEKNLIQELLSRFEKWRSLFDKAASHGLSENEQRGLFGELYFLRKLIATKGVSLHVIESWVGSEKQIKDFQFGKWCVEVKTTHGNNHQRVHISSERQLDISNLDNLYLYHISLDIRQNSGESLNELIYSIIDLLHSDFISLNKFNSKLLEVGYFEKHKHLYDSKGYFIRQDLFYKIENEFPRIEEAEIRKGVGDVKYSIVVSQCSKFIKTEQEVMQGLNFYD